MATKKKLLQAAAGAGGEALNVEEVFSTYLYEGTGTTLTITNGIDLDGEGGLVWHKYRSGTSDHGLFDTERGVSRKLTSNDNSAQTSAFSGAGITAFNSDGYTLGTQYSGENGSGNDVVSWTFRKAPKFFDVVTYTGTGSDQLIPHNLGCVPGFVVVKKTSGTGYWSSWHRSFTNNEYILLDLSNQAVATSQVRTVTDTHYEVHGNYNDENQSGASYVAYLFAHNDGDGEFGPDGDADIIKCGSYTGTSSSSTINQIDLGFEPQWLLIKGADYATDWQIYDNMRGIAAGGNDARIYANTNAAENNTGQVNINATGFFPTSGSFETNYQGKTYIYVAIRRGPMAVPENATDVFDVSEVNAAFITEVNVGFPVDVQIAKATSQISNHQVVDRMRGVRTNLNYASKKLYTNDNGTEQSDSNAAIWWNQTGFYIPGEWANINTVFYNWRRAPNYFDVVAYTGDGVAGRTVSHNLGVAPEMMWVKPRSATNPWQVYHSATGNTKALNFDNGTGYTSITYWYNTTPSSSEFTLGSSVGFNGSGVTYIAYLFASLAGISKVGSYTGNGSTQTIDCGFSSGARFVLIKRTDSAGDWYVWDTARGIVAGNDPHLSLNTTAAEVTTDDSIDPVSSGFAVNQVSATNMNVSSATYIFYAVA